LAIALYAALVTDDPNDALLVAVNHGGDSDSTASVCGNLVGAVYGTDVLRQDWVERVQFHDVLDRLVTDALAEFGTTPPDWGTRYPPS
jgi:ADP-ribosylglycohydrolase